MNKKLVMGVFDSEKFWRDDTVAVLPGIHDQSSANIIRVMDELLFAFCTKDDVLITARKMHAGLKDYLNGIGLLFTCNAKDVEDGCDGSSGENNVFKAATLPDNISHLSNYCDADTHLSPYAVIPHAKEMCDTLSIQYALPALEQVKAVNSKIYSNMIKANLGLNGVGEVVYDTGQLAATGQALLKQGAFLIKDEYGVSGKGNFLIDSEKILLRIVKYLKKQEENRKTVKLLLEPLFDKQLDFSCSIVSDAEGKVHIDSVQMIINNSFNYAGTGSIGADVYKLLEAQGYFTTMETIAGELYKDGYFGEIGIDSMILKDGSLIPLIEINARKTMGMINKRINEFLKQFSLEGQLALYSVGYTQPIEYGQLLSRMKECRILFEPGSEKGIIPLSANTMVINNGDLDGGADGTEIGKGRFYYSAAAATKEERSALIQKTGEFFKTRGLKIY